MAKKQYPRKGKDEVRTRFNALTALSLLRLGLRLRNSILEVSRGAFYVEDKVFGIPHYILDGEMQLDGGQHRDSKIKGRRARISSRTPTFPMGILIVPVLSPLHSVVPCNL